MSKTIKADNYFAIIPEWVLFADISANAVRLYGVLRRYADAKGRCHPSRQTLSAQCRISLPTLAKATEELVALGALSVQHRRTKHGDFTSNQYTVVSVDPQGVGKNLVPPSKENDTTGGKESLLQTRAIDNQSQQSDKATDVARLWWDSQEIKPLGKRAWFALVNVVRASLERGFSEQQIINVLNDAGCVPSIPEMDKRLRGKWQTGRARTFTKAQQDLAELEQAESFWAIGELNEPK